MPLIKPRTNRVKTLRHICRLQEPNRDVLVQCYYRGCSVAEAAATLGVPEGTVKSRTHYALLRLRLALAEMGVEQ